MISIACRNLVHDELKLVTALTGVTFAVLLVTCLCGLYVACGEQASGIIDHAGADLWIASSETRSVDVGVPISDRRLYQALAVPGVLWAEPLLVQFSRWRLADGRREMTYIVGLTPDSRLNLPWGMAAGSPDAIRHPDGVIIDERERKRFGTPGRPLDLGDEAEILDQHASVVGFSRGVGSISTIPYVFTTHRQAEQFTIGDPGRTTFVLVKCAPEASIAEVRARLAERLPDVDVMTAAQFSRKSRHYWLFDTGIGACIVFTAILAVIVGCVMVSQTIYGSTMNRLAEFGTLKALGMGNFGLTRIVLEQALVLGIVSYVIGIGLALAIAQYAASSKLTIATPPWLFGAMLGVTLLTCAAASVTSVAKVYRLPPASVFRS